MLSWRKYKIELISIVTEENLKYLLQWKLLFKYNHFNLTYKYHFESSRPSLNLKLGCAILNNKLYNLPQEFQNLNSISDVNPHRSLWSECLGSWGGKKKRYSNQQSTDVTTATTWKKARSVWKSFTFLELSLCQIQRMMRIRRGDQGTFRKAIIWPES